MLKVIEDKIRETLDNRGWNYDFVEEKSCFVFGVRIDKPVQRLDYIISVEDDNFTVIARIPIKADNTDLDQMQIMRDFLHKANFGMKVGCFEINSSDGEIRFKVYVDCEDIVPSTAMIENGIEGPANAVSFYGESIIGIIYKDFSVEQAIEWSEGLKGIAKRHKILEERIAAELGMDIEELKQLMENHAAIVGRVGAKDVHTEYPEWDAFSSPTT